MSKWGKVDSATWISTGCLRINHSIGDTNYNVATEMNQSGIYAYTAEKYNTYCIVYVKTFSGTLINGSFTFWLVRAL